MSSTTELSIWLNGTPTGGPEGDGRYPLTYQDGNTYLVYCPAAQALNPSLAEQPIEVFANTASAAAVSATDSADAATQAKIDAQTAAANAAASATTANTHKNAAATSATAAATSATAADASAVLADADRIAAETARDEAEAAAASVNLGNYYQKTETDSLLSAKVGTTTEIIAGNGMTGGGDLSTNRTVTLGTPSVLTADSISEVTATSHSHLIQTSYLWNDDDRSGVVRTTPDTYRDRGLSTAFNSGANVGLAGTYAMTLHLAPWTVYNNLYKQQQLGFPGGGGGIFWRTAISDIEWGPWYQVHTEASTNINAATLDGWARDITAAVNTVVGRNASGDIFARLFRSEYTTTNPTIGYFMTQVEVGVGANNYLRPSTPAQVKSALAITMADVIDLPTPSDTAVNGTLVKRSPSGYVYANFFNSTAGFSSAAPTAVFVETSSDGFLRKQTLANLRTNMAAVENVSGVAKINKLTQAAYDAIGTKDANTLYVIVG